MNNATDAPLPASSEWYRAQARRFTNLAAIAIVPQVRVQLMGIIREYEELAQAAKKSKDH